MINRLSHKIVNYMTLMSNTDYNTVEKEQMVYTLEAFLGDASKTLILFLVFLAVGYEKYYLVAVLTTVLLRTNMGGFHFSGYFKCLLFSSLYFAGLLLLYELNIGSMPVMLLLAGLSLIIQSFLVPVVTKQREQVKALHRDKLKMRSMLYSSIIIGLHIIINNPYTLIAIWIVIIQTLFILIYKGEKIYESFYAQNC